MNCVFVWENGNEQRGQHNADDMALVSSVVVTTLHKMHLFTSKHVFISVQCFNCGHEGGDTTSHSGGNVEKIELDSLK